MVKVNFTQEQAMKAQRGSRGVILLFFNLSARFEWVVNAALRPLYLREGNPVPIVQELSGPRAGLDGCGKSRPHRDSIRSERSE